MEKVELFYDIDQDVVRDKDTQEVVFSTKLSDKLSSELHRSTMVRGVVDSVVNIWNLKKTIEGNLFSDGDLDEYLLYEIDCSQDEREIIVESLFSYLDTSIE